MKVLGIVGSIRKKGNTASLVRTALEAVEREGIKTQLIFLHDYTIKDCTGCERCKDTYICSLEDDMQEIYPLLLEADGIICGSPTYFYNITANMKAFIDRCYCFEAFAEDDRSCWANVNEALGGKYASVIAVCEQNDEKDMGFTAEAMVKPLESLGYRIIDIVKAFRLFRMGDALNHPAILESASAAGKKLAKTLILREQIRNKLKSR